MYSACSSLEEAKQIAFVLLEEGLAACINIYPQVISIYKWQAEILENTEVVLLAKTQQASVGPLIDRIKSLHSYECPAILSIPVDEAYKPYVD